MKVTEKKVTETQTTTMQEWCHHKKTSTNEMVTDVFYIPEANPKKMNDGKHIEINKENKILSSVATGKTLSITQSISLENIRQNTKRKKS